MFFFPCAKYDLTRKDDFFSVFILRSGCLLCCCAESYAAALSCTVRCAQPDQRPRRRPNQRRPGFLWSPYSAVVSSNTLQGKEGRVHPDLNSDVLVHPRVSVCMVCGEKPRINLGGYHSLCLFNVSRRLASIQVVDSHFLSPHLVLSEKSRHTRSK